MKIGMLLLLGILFIGIVWLLILGIRRKRKPLIIVSSILLVLAFVATFLIILFYW